MTAEVEGKGIKIPPPQKKNGLKWRMKGELVLFFYKLSHIKKIRIIGNVKLKQ